MSKRKDRKGPDQPNTTTHQRDGPNLEKELSPEEVFVSKVLNCSESMLGIAWRRCGNPSDAEDAVASAICSAWQHYASFREESLFSTWIIRILIREINTSQAKTKKRTERSVPLEEAEMAESVRGRSAVEVERNDKVAAVNAAMEKLDPVDRAIIQDRAFEDLPNNKIAARDGLTVQATSMRYTRAIERLRQIIAAAD